MAWRADVTDVVVVSPHLDDAVLSVGGFIHRLTRGGGRVRIVTALALDPATASSEPGWWDAKCGFSSAVVAAHARRAEDQRACRILGAMPVWLPYGHSTHGRGATDEEIWAALTVEIAAADLVLLPGYPLAHPDHRWLTRLVMKERHGPARIAFYAEQPYLVGSLMRKASDPLEREGEGSLSERVRPPQVRQVWSVLKRERPPESALRDSGISDQAIRWGVERTSLTNRHAKRRAITSYRSQLRGIGLAPIVGALAYEALNRGELVARPVD